MENSPSRVVIIDTAWLGDVLFTTSLVGAVRMRWPSTAIDLVVAPRARELVEHHPHLNCVWIFDKRGEQRGMKGINSLARSLNEHPYDLCLCAHPSTRSRLLCGQLNCPVKVGYKGLGAARVFTHLVADDLALEPDHVERRLNLLRTVVDVHSAPPLLVGLTEGELASARQKLAGWGFQDCEVMALIPGSAWKTKQWPTEYFRELANSWISSAPNRAAVALIGPKEQASRALLERLQDSRFRVESLSLRECAALFSLCNAAAGNDTGVSFLAIAAGCPEVHVLYGSTQVNYAFPPPHRGIHAGTPCCLSRTGHGRQNCGWTDGEPWCMAQISPGSVLSRLLSSRR
ncbi:MAG: glycosyltransferase family 9 protein [Calditrichaeota bacterium]|nr:glycosyltransferase family 9 protein [Calditrichota bacterium]MCB9391934.1 glycosyltransferase family 9 protein [Calditrichota bacterium]